MVSVKRNSISKKQRHTIYAGNDEAPCVIIHSFDFSHNHTCTVRGTYFLILLHSKSFSYLFPPRNIQRREEKNISTFNTDVVVPKALFLKWNFMSVIVYIPFHHRVTTLFFLRKKKKIIDKATREEEKVRLKCDDGRKKIVATNMRHFSSPSAPFFLCKKFFMKKTCRDFASF